MRPVNQNESDTAGLQSYANSYLRLGKNNNAKIITHISSQVFGHDLPRNDQ